MLTTLIGESYRAYRNRLVQKLTLVSFNHLEHLSLLAINQIGDIIVSKSGFGLLSYFLVLKTIDLSAKSDVEI